MSILRAPRWRRRRVVVGVGAAVLVAGAFLGWLAVSAVHVRSDLSAAAEHAERAKAALLRGDDDAGQQEVQLTTAAAGRAHSATGSLPWDVAVRVPWLGAPFRTARDISSVVDGLATQVFTPAARAGRGLAPTSLRGQDGRLDLAAVTAAQRPLATAATSARVLAGRADAIPGAGYLTSVDQARVGLARQTRELSDVLGPASTAVDVLPAMLGQGGPRNYFLAFQTNAEARGTGGLVGGFALLKANAGLVSLDTLASNRALLPGTRPLDLGADFDNAYRNYESTTSWANSNISPNFPYAAQIWNSLWQQQGGGALDGSVATDPVALSYVLEATGPVTVAGGQRVDAGNVVELTESTAYTRFADDNAARKDYLQAIASAVVSKVLTAGPGATPGLIRALARSAGEGRLAVYSNDPGEEQVLAGTAVGGAVPTDAAPYAGVAVTNAAGNKLDYYLGRSVTYAAGACTGSVRTSSVTIALTNNAPAEGLPPYVAGRLDPGAQGPPGTTRSLVTLTATQGALLSRVSLDGAPTAVSIGHELGHPMFTANLQIAPGETVTLRFDLVEPNAPGAARVPVQPLVQPARTTVGVPECRSDG